MTALKSVESHIEYYEGLRNTTRHTARQAVSDIRARFVEPDADEGQNAQFQRLVVQSLGDNEPERLARLSKLSGVPVRKTVEVTVFQRNPDVVAQALVNAKGVCQRCCQPAPFTRKDGAPYLEVHHIIPLAIGGLDTLGNVAAICPNCHREAHFGSEPITFLSTAASAR
ncbi:HNH endonuclease [Pseudorhodobacter sp. E13]|nr:HNH endonuclease [Pseudorhodobacter sp. E13]